MRSYAYASVASVVVALGFRRALEGQTRRLTGAKLIVANSFSSIFACSAASFLNAYIMRQTEIEKGIDVFDPNEPEVPLGKSKAAAYSAVVQTATSRYILNWPLFLPSLLFLAMERARVLPTAFLPKTILETGVFFMGLYYAVPMGIAYYPQYGVMASDQLEEEFRDLKDKQGRPIKELMFNKGL